MKLFIKDHLWVIMLYGMTFIGLALLYNVLDGFEIGMGYFIFLSMSLLGCFLIYRYLTMIKLYRKLSERPTKLDELVIPNPRSSLETAFTRMMQQYKLLFNQEVNDVKQTQLEYKMMLHHWIHQMKTPVSVISLLSQSNEDHPDFEKVSFEAERLDYNLYQMLTYLRLDEFEKDIKIESLQLKSIVIEVINELKPFFIARSVYPKVLISSELTISSDKKWLKSALYQIVNNAIKYSTSGKSVHITANASNNQTELMISNEGIGIKKSDIRRIFDKFYTGSIGRQFGESTGLGLYITRQIFDMLEHRVDVKSQPGELTSFTVTFKS